MPLRLQALLTHELCEPLVVQAGGAGGGAAGEGGANSAAASRVVRVARGLRVKAVASEARLQMQVRGGALFSLTACSRWS